MLTTVLVRVAPQTRPAFPLQRALCVALSRVRALPGFRRCQTFRTLEAPEEWILAVDWDSGAAARQALADPLVRSRLEETGARIEVLRRTFDRQLVQWESVASLIRISAGRGACPIAAERESDYALRALAAPGSVRLSGAHSLEGETAVCRIEFDTEDGLWHFLESPLCRIWSRQGVENGEEVRWGLNQPRLEWHRRQEGRTPRRRVRPRQSLSLELSLCEENQSARVRLEGQVNSHGSELSERFCEALIQNGCLRLEVDVSGLEPISERALGMLTRAARSLKDRGGEFVLIDNEERVSAVTRSHNLRTSLQAARSAS